MFDWRGIYYPPLGGVACKTKEAKNCDILEEWLKKHCVPVDLVCRHELFGIDYFEVRMKKDARHIMEDEIANILDIPSEWVGFTQATPKIICIKEDELIEKYGDYNGILSFEKWSIKGKTIKEVREQLKRNGINAEVGKTCMGHETYTTIVVQRSSNFIDFEKIADVLNIDEDDIGVVECNRSYIVRIR